MRGDMGNAAEAAGGPRRTRNFERGVGEVEPVRPRSSAPKSRVEERTLSHGWPGRAHRTSSALATVYGPGGGLKHVARHPPCTLARNLHRAASVHAEDRP